MIGIFKQKNPGNLILLLIIGFLLKLPMFMHIVPPVAREEDGLFFEMILDFLKPIGERSPIIYPVLTFVIQYVQAVMLTHFINKHKMMAKSTFLPGLAYMLLTSLLPEWNTFSAPLLVNIMLLYMLSALFGTYNKQQVNSVIFNIGMTVGVSGFFFVSSVLLLLWVLLAFAILRPFSLKEWVLCLAGFLTPFYFYVIIILIDGSWNWSEVIPPVSVGLPSLSHPAWQLTALGLILLPFFICLGLFQLNMNRMLINIRKGWNLLLLYLLTALFLPFINTTDSYENWILALIPLSAFHAYAYLNTIKVVPLLFFWIIVAFVIGWQYYGVGWI